MRNAAAARRPSGIAASFGPRSLRSLPNVAADSAPARRGEGAERAQREDSCERGGEVEEVERARAMLVRTKDEEAVGSRSDGGAERRAHHGVARMVMSEVDARDCDEGGGGEQPGGAPAEQEHRERGEPEGEGSVPARKRRCLRR